MQNLEKRLEEKISKISICSGFSNIIFLCVGTSKIIGDSLGPIIGSKLKCLENEFIHIYGTIEQNLNFMNAKMIIEKINSIYENPYIITIDAALSNKGRIGDITIETGYIKIGKALEKSLCFYSNINIKCIVGKVFQDKEKNLEELQKVTIDNLLILSNNISNAIINVLEKKIVVV